MPQRILVYGMTDNPGGIETYLMNQLRALDREKAVFDFVTDFPKMAYEKEARELGSKIYFIPAKSKGLIGHWRAFSKILKAHPEYKTVYFNVLDAGAALTELVPWLRGRTVITHSHNGSTDKMKLHKLCRPFLNLFTKRRYACSRLAAAYMFGKKKAEIIPNMINAEKFAFSPEKRAEKRAELKIGDRFAVCHIGRLSNQKNPLGLIDIFAEVLKRDKNAVLLSVGSGEMEEEVRKYARDKGIAESIMFLGRRSDTDGILSAADVFLLPSFYEGLPIVAIEAQAAGLPLVMSDSITKECAVTENAVFLSLRLPLDAWADTVVSFKNFKRLPTRDKIAAAGYDSADPGQSQKELKKYFEQQGNGEG